MRKICVLTLYVMICVLFFKTANFVMLLFRSAYEITGFLRNAYRLPALCVLRMILKLHGGLALIGRYCIAAVLETCLFHYKTGKQLRICTIS